LTFKDLDVGDKFEFVRDGISTTQMAHGPWRKFGPQKYQHENGTVILRIGTTSARVRRVNPAPRGAAWVTSEEASDEDIKRLEDAGMIQFGGKTRDGVRMYFLTSKGSGALSGPDYDAEHPFGFVSHDPELEPELAAWDAMSRRSYGRKRNPGSVTFPTVAEVTAGLKDLQKEVRKWQGLRGDGVDVRLQVTSKSWAIHYGDPGYDQDHHGWWGADFLGPDALDTDLKAMAKRLIEEAEEQFQEELS
jgi:hypothetical protein